MSVEVYHGGCRRNALRKTGLLVTSVWEAHVVIS
jgi:hypothetical protein